MDTAFGLVLVALGVGFPIAVLVVVIRQEVRRRKAKRLQSSGLSYTELMKLRDDLNDYLNQDHSALHKQYLEGKMSEMQSFDWESDRG